MTSPPLWQLLRNLSRILPDQTRTVQKDPNEALRVLQQGQNTLLPERAKNAIYDNVIPFGYLGHDKEMKGAVKDFFNLGSEVKDNKDVLQRVREAKGSFAVYVRDNKVKRRDDAFRLYLGLPQQNNTFSVSAHKPSGSEENKQYYKINNFTSEWPFADEPKELKYYIQHLKDYPTDWDKLKDPPSLGREIKMDSDNGIMGQYKVSLGKDEHGHYISYYDKWDLDHPRARQLQDAGLVKPFEIYDRIYYNPKTYKIIPEEEIHNRVLDSKLNKALGDLVAKHNDRR